MRCIWLLWSSLSWVAAVLCTIGCMLPYWLKGSVYIATPGHAIKGQSQALEDTILKSQTVNAAAELSTALATDLGLFRRCGYPVYANWVASDKAKAHSVSRSPPVHWQAGCGHYTQLTHVPHVAWHIGFFALVTACAILFFTTFFLFLMGFTLYLIAVRSVYRTCQLLLLTSGCLTLTTCALYPVGWTDNSEVKQACGEEANSLNLGRCHIGWAYVLTCSGGLLSLFAASLPIIFPTHIKRAITGGFRDGYQRTNGSVELGNKPRRTTSCTCHNSSSPSISLSRVAESTPGGSVAAFVQPHAPSPTQSVAVSQRNNNHLLFRHSQPLFGSALFLPPASVAPCVGGGGVSPSESSSSPGPGSSVTEKVPSARSTRDQNNNTHSSSQGMVPHNLLRAGHTHYPFVATYAPQRYSTGALLGHIYPMTNQQRITPSINADPLIYLAEEEECDHDHVTQSDPRMEVNQQTDEVVDTKSEPDERLEVDQSSSGIIQGTLPGSLHRTIVHSTVNSQRIHDHSNPLDATSETDTITSVTMRWIDPQAYSPLLITTGEENRNLKSAGEPMNPKRTSCAL